MTRLCIANGPWQLIMLYSALGSLEEKSSAGGDRNLLAYYHRSLSEPLIGLMDEIRSLPLVNWDKRFLFNDVLSIRRLKSSWSWSSVLDSIRTRVESREIDEIWATSIADWPEGAVAAAFPGARVVQYEDGLSSYFEGEDPGNASGNSVAKFGILQRRLKNYLPCLNPLVIWRAAREARRLKNRCSARYLYLANWLKPNTAVEGNRTHLVPTSAVRDVTRALAGQLVTRTDRELTAALPDDSAIVIAQNFSDGNQLDRQTECGVYRESVRILLESGFRVLWKEHPRSLKPFCPGLQREFGDRVMPYPISSRIPLEITVEHMTKMPVFVGALSTSLFYLRHLYGCDVYQFAGAMRPHLAGTYARMASHVARHFPSISEIQKRP